MRIIPSREISNEAYRESRIRAGTQKHVLLMTFGRYKDLTDLEAAELSGLGTTCEYEARCRELRRMKLIEQVPGTRQGHGKSQRMICKITDKGREKLGEISAAR